MDRALATLLITAALPLLLLGPAAAARPTMGRRNPGTETAALALAPAGHRGRGAAADDVVAAGKWLPLAGAHHLPPAYWAHRPVPWVGAGPGDLGLGGAGAGSVERGEVDEPERELPSYERERSATTRQEQLAMWASLLDPTRGKHGRAAAAGWLPVPGTGGDGEAADREPDAARAADAVEGAEGDDQTAAAGHSYWRNNGNR